jgi:hypothetical protein
VLSTVPFFPARFSRFSLSLFFILLSALPLFYEPDVASTRYLHLRIASCHDQEPVKRWQLGFDAQRVSARRDILDAWAIWTELS